MVTILSIPSIDKIIEKIIEELILPAKIQVLPGFIFRRSKPAIVGVKVIAGRIRPKLPIMNSKGASLGVIKSIQSEGKSLTEASAGMEVAVSITKGVVGKNLDEGDYLYVDIPESIARRISRDLKLRKMLPPDVLDVFKETVEIKRRLHGFTWGR